MQHMPINYLPILNQVHEKDRIDFIQGNNKYAGTPQ